MSEAALFLFLSSVSFHAQNHAGYLALDMVEGKQVVIKENFPRDSSLRSAPYRGKLPELIRCHSPLHRSIQRAC